MATLLPNVGQQKWIEKPLLATILCIGIVEVILGAGLFLQVPGVLALWPWPISKLSAIFLSSICAAIAAPVLWIGLTRDFAAILGGAVNLGITSGGIGIFVLQSAKSPSQVVFAWILLGFCATCLFQVFLAKSYEYKDLRPTPTILRIAFALFTLILILVGTTMVRNSASMFPWELKPAQSTIYGWIFLGASSYFLIGVLKPVWSNAVGQLLGFLAYDLVLIVPYIQHFRAVPDSLRNNLIVYVSVLIVSGILAIAFLFVIPEYRFKIQKSPHTECVRGES